MDISASNGILAAASERQIRHPIIWDISGLEHEIFEFERRS